MANALGAFYELPPWLEEMQRVQRNFEAIMKPLTALQDDRWLALKSMTATFESPVIREMELLAKQCTPRVMEVLQQEQELLSKFAPLADIYTQAVGQIPDWTRSIFDATLFQYDNLLIARDRELLRWTEVVDSVVNTTEIGEVDPGEMAELSEEEQEAITTEIAEVFADKENWDQRFMASMVKFKNNHPTLAWIFEKVFLTILLEVIAGLLCTAIGQTLFSAKVYEEPSAASQVVYHVEQHQPVVVIGKVPYYYEVEVRPKNAGGVKRGYMSKRSILIKGDNENFVEVAMDE